MKKQIFSVLALAAVMATSVAQATCTTIQDGTLNYSASAKTGGQPFKLGVDAYGYNYQAHSFNGSLFNSYANSAGFAPYEGDDNSYLNANVGAEKHWAWEYRNINLAMKWNDAWLSNKDCDGDGKLDRHYGFGNYIGSGAWLTNHESWTVTTDEGKDRPANDFIKIVAIPAGAQFNPESSYFGEGTVSVNGVEMGDVIWGEFAVIQYILNDPSSPTDPRVRMKSQINAGFGSWKP